MPAHDHAYSEGRGCYTTARVRDGQARFAERHVRRLRRGADALQLGEVRGEDVLLAFATLGRAAFGAGEGVVRLQVSRDADGATHLIGLPRALGDDRGQWRVISAPQCHAGPILSGGHKLTNRLLLALALDAAVQAGVDDALLFDSEGRLVETARSNIVLVDASHALVTPPLARGAVAGIAREVIGERVPELRERDLRARDLEHAREVIAVNAVRGARAIVEIDGRAVGSAEGPGLTRLGEALARD